MIDRTKFATETFPLTIDFTSALPAAETVNTATVTATDSLGVDASAALIGTTSVSTPRITALIKATATGSYFITYTATTSPGAYKIVEQVQLQVI